MVETVLSLVASYWLPSIGLLVAGSAAGILAGLLGVGGGIVIVPVLYIFLDTFDLADTRIAMNVAVATSLATIVVTAVSSARSCHWRGAVDSKLLQGLPPGSLGYASVPGFLAFVPLTTLFAPVGSHASPPAALRYSFAAFLMLTAIRLAMSLFEP